MSTSTGSLMILVAGPYRSGTGDDPRLLAANHRAMTDVALQLYRAGHLPVTGEALALPMAEAAGSQRPGDAAFDEIFHPIAERLLRRCDAVLRVGGPSQGADMMVRQAREQGLLVFTAVDQVPPVDRVPAVEAEPSPVEVLRLWEASGAPWRVVSRTAAGLDVALVTCDGGEEVGRVRSGDPDLVRYVGDREGSDL